MSKEKQKYESPVIRIEIPYKLSPYVALQIGSCHSL